MRYIAAEHSEGFDGTLALPLLVEASISKRQVGIV